MDLIHNEKHSVSLPAAAYTKAGGAVDGAEIDTFGAERVLIQALSGALGAQVNVYEIELTASDTAGAGHAAVPDAELIGTEPTFNQAVAADSNAVKLFEYVGGKRYVKANLKVPTGAGTGSGVVGANVILGGLRHSVLTP
jgi:hypothetical protein